MAVFVLDKSGKPLMPCSEKRARLLLERGRGRSHIQTSQGVVQGITHRHCSIMQRNDGYGYSTVAKMESEQVCHKARIAPQSALYLLGTNAGVSRVK
jgi:hypothetical protein